MFFIWSLAPALYVVCRFVLLLPLPLYVRLALSLVVLLGCEFHFISRRVFGSMFSPEWPHSVMLLLGWLLGSVVLFACFLLARDIVAALASLLFARNLPFLLTTVPLLCVSIALAAYGVREATRVPAVKTVNITLPSLPQAFEGYRIIQLSDIHASRLLTREWVEKVVDKTNALQADLIVLTGDMSDGTVANRRDDVAPLARLSARDGRYAITGNHEYYFDYAAWMTEWSRLGLPFLLNSHIRLARGEASLVIAGVTDDRAPGGANLARALDGVQPGETVILLDHRPGHAPENARHGIALQLSGHTHGGMVRLLDEAVKPPNNGFISGRYLLEGMQLYVSNGTGLWNGFPLRIGRPSEITELILHRAPDTSTDE